MGKKGEETFTLQSPRNQSFSELQERNTNFKCYKLHHLISNYPVLTWAQALRTSSIVTFLISFLILNIRSMLRLNFLQCIWFLQPHRLGSCLESRIKMFMLLSKWTFGPQPIRLILCLDFLKITINYWVIALDKVCDKSEWVVTVSKGQPATFWLPFPLVHQAILRLFPFPVLFFPTLTLFVSLWWCFFNAGKLK